MRILQVTGKTGGIYFGKWWCSDSAQPVGDIPIIRYLRKDGTWDRTTEYFDSKEEIENLLKTAGPPDFSVDAREAVDRDYWRDVRDEELRGMDRDWHEQEFEFEGRYDG